MLSPGDLIRIKADDLGILLSPAMIGKHGVIIKEAYGIYTVLIDNQQIDVLDIMIERLAQ